MRPERWQRVKDVFAGASALESAARERYLDELCADDAELRAEVASLLAAHRTADAILDRPASEYASLGEAEPAVDPWIGRRIGAYELLAVLGRGGMGTVYRARRADAQYAKEVAIKLVRSGLDSAFVLQRFRAERQFLADLEHPNIARLLDAGATDGQPYLVMELVQGVPIDAYCRERQLGVPARLRLFLEVCAAVSYAHQRLIVHRDLKPGNILVSDAGAIKLLDFGIAKLLQPGDTAAAADDTRTSLRALTPAFSSPEQILGLHVTTASDVYSLGVVLFHLLTGRSPYRSALSTNRDAIKEVCETEPPRPSVAAARSRADDAAQPIPDRDLDAITLRALRKEPARRYASVEQLSEDLRRYLGGLPVRARGDQLAYRTGKFLRRHRVGLAAALLVSATLLGGVLVATHEASIARQQQLRAERHFASVRQLANTFMFGIDDSIRDLPGGVAARAQLVTTALAYLDTLAKESSGDRGLQRELAQAYLRVADIQGEVYNPNTGNPQPALESYASAIALLETLNATGPPSDEIRTQLALAHLKRSRLFLLVSGDARAATAESRRAIAIFQQAVAAHPADLAARGRLATAYIGGGFGMVLSGEVAEAIANAHRAIDLLEELHRQRTGDGTFEENRAAAYMTTGTLTIFRDDEPATWREAIALNEKSLAISEHLLQTDPQHPLRYYRDLGGAHNNIGVQLFALGDYRTALEHLRAAADYLGRTTADPNNWQARLDTARATVHLGETLTALNRLTEAQSILEATAASMHLMAQHGDTLDVQYQIGRTEAALGSNALRRAARPGLDRIARLGLWQAARGSFTSALERYRHIVRNGVKFSAQDRGPFDLAAASLPRADAEIARLGGPPPAVPLREASEH